MLRPTWQKILISSLLWYLPLLHDLRKEKNPLDSIIDFYSFLEMVEQVLPRHQTYQNLANLGEKFNMICN
jgi:hypothetical protein